MHPARSLGPGPSTCLGPTRTQPWRGPEPGIQTPDLNLTLTLSPTYVTPLEIQVQDVHHDPHDHDCGVSCLETDSKTNRQTDRQTDRQTHRPLNIDNNRERKCADTIGTVPVPWAGYI